MTKFLTGMISTDVTGTTNINTFDDDGFSSTMITKNGFVMGTRYNYHKQKTEKNSSGLLDGLSNVLVKLFSTN
jgi:hypothetical protein